MISLFFFMLTTPSFAREFPDKEITRRCDLNKVKVCIDENQQRLQFANSEQNRFTALQIQAQRALGELQTTIAPIDEELQGIAESQLALDDFLREKSVEKSEYQPIFSFGPILLETKLGQFFPVNTESTDRNGLRSLFQKDRNDLELVRLSLAREQLFLANRINELQSEIASTQQEISRFDMLKRQHGQMCEFGCKQKFCPEN
jgi:hypothetical protein